MSKYNQNQEPRERPELRALETLQDGTLAITRTGTICHGSAFTRLSDALNENCPEYILGQLALAAGYAPLEKVEYELRVKPKKK